MLPMPDHRPQGTIINRGRPWCRALLLAASLALVLTPCLPRPVQAQAADPSGCPADGSSQDQAGCRRGGLSRFQPPDRSATQAAPASKGLSAYDPDARKPRQPRSPDMALEQAPSMFIRTMRWLATAMVTAGLGMMAARSWIRERIRKSDEAATQDARRMLREAEAPRVLLAPAPVPARRIQWTPDRIGALRDEDYARLCASYWETRGYEASLANPDDVPGQLIELRRLPERKLLQGLVCCLTRDDGRIGVQAVRRLSEARHRDNIAMAVIMSRGALSEQAAALAAQHALQTMDEAALLNQLRVLSQDQQEALFAELDAYIDSGARASVEASAS